MLMMLLADGRLPVGGHTQSAGLEPALRAGMPATAVPGYIAARLRTVTLVEAGAAVAARHAVNAQLHDALQAVDEAWRARTISGALRANAVRQGRNLRRLLERLWPGTPQVAALAAISQPVRATVLGVAGALAALNAAELAALVGYDDVQTVASAALKLEPLDPFTATGWVLAAAPHVQQLAERVAGITGPDQIPAVAGPMIESWAQRHEVADRRLFRS